ncbi:MAG TPA: hypothetical protein VNN17_04655, partial [Terriglobia bacterium]|nr:hypothetical protein [Terriglobia bacterium]
MVYGWTQMTEDAHANERARLLRTADQEKDYWVSGCLVFLRPKGAGPPSEAELQPRVPSTRHRSRDAEHKLLGFPVVHD